MRFPAFWVCFALGAALHVAAFAGLANIPFGLYNATGAPFKAFLGRFTSRSATFLDGDGHPVSERLFTVPTAITAPAPDPNTGLDDGRPAPPNPARALPAPGRPAPSRAAAPADSKFFGLTLHGRSVIYLLDVSGSMLEASGHGATKLQFAQAEILRSLRALPDSMLFNIVIFADRSMLFAPAPVPATSTLKSEAERFLVHDSALGGTTDLPAGVTTALRQTPDTVFLVTDGGANMPPEVFFTQFEHLRKRENWSARIHSVGFGIPPNSQQEAFLRTLAERTGGRYFNWIDTSLSSR